MDSHLSPKLHRQIRHRPDVWCTLCASPASQCNCTENDYADFIDGWTPKPTPWYERQPRRQKAGRRQPTDMENKFRHSHWQARRERVLQAMIKANVKTNAFESFCFCGSGCQVQWSESLQKHRIAGSFCHSRHCEPCQRSRAALIRNNLTAKLGTEHNRRFRFMTFTLKHTDTPLQEQISRLYESFKQLRKTKVWKRSQRGGCFMLEVKLAERQDNQTKPHWHPHLHVIADGNFIAQSDLRTEWFRITGDSFIVDVRAIDRGKDVAGYVTKYITKGTTPAVWNDEELAIEWINASRGTRACSTFGDWRGWKLTQKQKTADDWQHVGTLDELISHSRTGEENAHLILMSLRPPGEAEENLLTSQ